MEQPRFVVEQDADWLRWSVVNVATGEVVQSLHSEERAQYHLEKLLHWYRMNDVEKGKA